MAVSPATGKIALQRMLCFAYSAAKPFVIYNHGIRQHHHLLYRKRRETRRTNGSLTTSIPHQIRPRSRRTDGRDINKDTTFTLLPEIRYRSLCTMIDGFDINPHHPIEFRLINLDRRLSTRSPSQLAYHPSALNINRILRLDLQYSYAQHQHYSPRCPAPQIHSHTSPRLSSSRPR